MSTPNPEVLAGLQRAFVESDDEGVKRNIGYAWEIETNSWSTVTPHVSDRIRAWTPPQGSDPLNARIDAINDSVQSLDRDHHALTERMTGLETRLTDGLVSGGEYREATAARLDALLNGSNALIEAVRFQDRTINSLIDRVKALESPQREAAAPDDPVCARFEKVARAAYADWVASKFDWGSGELRAAIHDCVDANDFESIPAPPAAPEPPLDPVLNISVEFLDDGDGYLRTEIAGVLRNALNVNDEVLTLDAAWRLSTKVLSKIRSYGKPVTP